MTYEQEVAYYRDKIESIYAQMIEYGATHIYDSDVYFILGVPYPEGRPDRKHVIREYAAKPSNVVNLSEYRKRKFE